MKGLECQAKDFGIYPGGSREPFKIFFYQWDDMRKALL